MRCLYLRPVTKSTLERVVGLEIFLSITAVFVDTVEHLCYKLRKPLVPVRGFISERPVSQHNAGI
jgi:hypothetical protein